jgi:hypothetical protein
MSHENETVREEKTVHLLGWHPVHPVHPVKKNKNPYLPGGGGVE